MTLQQVRLRPTQDFIYRKTFNFLVTYDHSAGKADRYTVFILSADDPVTIGRELPLKTVRELIAYYENTAQADGYLYMGDRRTAIAFSKRVQAKRTAEYEATESARRGKLRPVARARGSAGGRPRPAR